MAVLEKIRVRLGVFITVLIGVALLSFVIDANTLRSVISMFSSRYDVGSMSGTSISYQDYQKKIDYYSTISQLINGTNSLSEASQERVREQAWQDYFQEYVMNAEYEKCGLSVSDDEMLDLARGRYISPILYNDPVFAGEDGTFSRTAVVNFVQGIHDDPNRAMYWSYVERRIKEVQLIEKYVSLLYQSDFFNTLQVQDAVNTHNTMADISYVLQPLMFTADSSIKVTEADLKAYYKAHRKNFEQEASRDIEYVSFPHEPSDEDIRQTEEEAYKIFEEFQTATDLKQFVAFNSDRPFDDHFYKQGELSETLDEFASGATLASILPVYREDNTFTMARVAAIRNLPDSVLVRHIMLPLQGSTKEIITQRADSLITVLNKGGNFSYLAQLFSVDQAANRKEGELGWIKQGDMMSAMKTFEDTCFTVSKNKYFKAEGSYGIHVAQVIDRSPEHKKVKLAIVEKVAEPGNITMQSLFTQANELASLSYENYDEFVRISNEKGYVRVPANRIREADKNVAVFSNARELVRWIYEAKKHSVSSTLNLSNDYFVVATVTDIREAGIAPYEQVQVDIEPVVRREKQAEVYAQRITEAINNGASGLEAVAEQLNATVETAAGVSFGSSFIAGIGMDSKLQGAVAGVAENTLTGPVKGANGVYAFTVNAREVGGAYTEEDAQLRYRTESTQQRMYEFFSILEKTKEVKDWRFRYF
ncbi:MAG: SurA N-terminal domain-containing protein [Prevotellaceae bacterium]|jgi:peptidyl-prolyl cis-trans isomerase D|nr:SurA N-terminal domain-containing protein [Prevotellaceae bacterium]